MLLSVFGALLKQVLLCHYYASVREIQHDLFVCVLSCVPLLMAWYSKGTRVAKVVPSEAGLVTQLFLNPERERR